MKINAIKGALPSRDVELSEVPEEFFQEVDLSAYLDSAKLKVASQIGAYQSNQGATITPLPCWAVEFETFRRKTPLGIQYRPKKERGLYVIKTSRWASKVIGTGREKEKWRGVSLKGKCSPNHLFAVASSRWLVPFALAHRYIVYLPVESIGEGQQTRIRVQHGYSRYKETPFDSWMDRQLDEETKSIKLWTTQAQRKWNELKTERSPDLITSYLDYRNKLSKQKPKAIRVIHTRSRSFYAAVLNPMAESPLGIPFHSALVKTREGEHILSSSTLPLGGIVCDNKLHYIDVASEAEAYWMVGLFNSRAFREMVMKEARGEPPGIYSLPAKILNRLGLKFDSSDYSHLSMAKVAAELEDQMRKTIRRYIEEEKGIELKFIDDTDQGTEVPPTISSAYTRRLDAEELLNELESLAEIIMK